LKHSLVLARTMHAICIRTFCRRQGPDDRLLPCFKRAEGALVDTQPATEAWKAFSPIAFYQLTSAFHSSIVFFYQVEVSGYYSKVHSFHHQYKQTCMSSRSCRLPGLFPARQLCCESSGRLAMLPLLMSTGSCLLHSIASSNTHETCSVHQVHQGKNIAL